MAPPRNQWWRGGDRRRRVGRGTRLILPGRIVAAFVAAGGSVAMLLNPLTRDGLGSAITTGRLADLLLSGTVAAWAPQPAGLAVYLLPAAGGVLVVGAGLPGRTGALVQAGAGAVALATGLVVARALDWRPLSAPGAGGWWLWVGLAATTLAIALAIISMCTASTPGGGSTRHRSG